MVFITYARRTSRERAKALHRKLGSGLAFLDSSEIEVGSSISLGVVEALLAARVVVLMVDETYFQRWYYCLREFDTALKAFQRPLEQGWPLPRLTSPGAAVAPERAQRLGAGGGEGYGAGAGGGPRWRF